jgi:hypothetical protein
MKADAFKKGGSTYKKYNNANLDLHREYYSGSAILTEWSHGPACTLSPPSVSMSKISDMSR